MHIYHLQRTISIASFHSYVKSIFSGSKLWYRYGIRGNKKWWGEVASEQKICFQGCFWCWDVLAQEGSFPEMASFQFCLVSKCLLCVCVPSPEKTLFVAFLYFLPGYISFPGKCRSDNSQSKLTLWRNGVAWRIKSETLNWFWNCLWETWYTPAVSQWCKPWRKQVVTVCTILSRCIIFTLYFSYTEMIK